MSRFGFVGPSYLSTSPIADAEECINFYPEAIEGQGKTAYALYPTPGLKPVSKLVNETAIWGQKWVPAAGRYFAGGSHLYELDQNFTITDRGALTAPTGPITIICNQTQLLILSAGLLWVFTLATNTLAAVVSPPFPAVAAIGFSDGFAVAVQSSPADIALSSIGDFSTWNAINTSSISLFPDNIVSMVVDHRELVLFGNTKSVVYANAGAAIFPFQPVPGAFIEQGADSLSGQVQLDNSVMWTSFDERGHLVAYRSQGYVGQRISNHAVEQQWQSYATTSDLISYSLQMNGHPWWHLYFPTAGVSWRYDVATGMWHKALGWLNGAYTAHNTQNHAFAFGKHLMGDWASGTIYQMAMPSYNGASWDFCSDGANPIRRLRQSPYVQTEGVRVYHNRLQFDLETGLGPIPPLRDAMGNPRDPQMMVSWSNDGAKTFCPNKILNCGQGGNYSKRVFLNRLGSTLHGRVYRAVMTDPIPWRFADAWLDADPGFKPTQRLADQLRARA
jgi:hypothetical protein